MSNTSSATSAMPSKYSIPLLLALIAAGLAGNYFRYPIFLNIDFLFGSIFAMLALQFFGLGRGILAAAVIASYTYFIWNHPYAFIILTLEVMVVGWLIGRRKTGMVMADVLFWLIIGMPLVYLFYSIVMGASPSSTYIVMIKQAINGIANALVARLIFTGYSLRTRTALLSYREIVYNLLTFFVLFPTLILLMISSRTDFADTDLDIKSLLIVNIEHEHRILEDWAENRKTAVVNLAEMAETRSPQQMQTHLEQAAKADRNFLRIALHDSETITTAYCPMIDEQGHSNIGKSFTDRPYVPILRQNLKPMLSEVSLSKTGAPKPRVAMIAPVVANGKYNGHIAGILNLDQIKTHLDKSMKINNTFYTLLDNNSKVIMTNRADQKIMAPFDRGGGDLQKLDNRISQWLPTLPTNTPSAERWKKSFYFAEVGIGALDEWKLILEQPVAPFQKKLYDNYTGKLIQLFMILLGALALARFLSRRLISTHEKLQQVTRDLPIKVATNTKIDWPESGIIELNNLASNFKETSDSLAAQFNEIQQINHSLEQRIEDRTQELQNNQRFLSKIIENSGALIYVKDREGRHELVNATWEEVTGFNRQHAIGKTEMELFPESVARVFRANDLQAMECGSIIRTEETFEDASGKRVFLSIKFPMTDKSGVFNGVCGMSAEITDKKRVEDALKDSEERYRTIFEVESDAMVLVDCESLKFIDVNSAALNLYGFSREEMLQLTASDVSAEKAVTKRALSTNVTDVPLRWHQKKDGTIFPVEIAGAYFSSKGRTTHVAAIRDITLRIQQEEEKKEHERQLLQTQKLESLGVLAGGIAHDFNNILMVIMGNCTLAKKAPDAFEARITAIEKASERAAALCRQMLEYAGHTQIAKSKVNMEALITDMVDMLSSTCHKNITIKPVIIPNIPFIHGDASQIRQIAMNLIINATEAIGEAQGEIDIMLSKSTVNDEEPEKDHLGRGIPNGKYVCLEVTDNGCGMDEETKRKIFEPFYTTKFTGRGLGLSATLGIISGHDGALQLFSNPGKGTTFKIYLPALAKGSGGDESIGITSVPWQGSGTILLVEDEDQVRLIAKAILKEFGFTVLEAVNGKEAIELYQKYPANIDLVITDVGMPIMDGYELFFELKKLKPELPIIISSGFGDNDIGSKIPQEEMAGLISKPYNTSQLQDLLKRIIEGT